MFDLGWPEMAVIMLVALIVIGPKDLPKVARTIGQWTGKARALARDFQRSLDDMAREAELDEIKKSIDKASRFDVKKSIKDAVDPEDEFDRAFDIDNKMSKAKPSNVKPQAKAVTKSADSETAPPLSPAQASGDVALGKAGGDKAASEKASAAADDGASSRG